MLGESLDDAAGEAFDKTAGPLKKFMLTQTRDKDLTLFMDLAQIDIFTSTEEVPMYVLIPAYVISELRIAFQIGFMIFLPFLIVDLVVASVLMGMGMMNPYMHMNPMMGMGLFGGALRQAGENEDGLNRKLSDDGETPAHNGAQPDRFLKDWKRRVGSKIFEEEKAKIDKEIAEQGF